MNRVSWTSVRPFNQSCLVVPVCTHTGLLAEGILAESFQISRVRKHELIFIHSVSLDQLTFPHFSSREHSVSSEILLSDVFLSIWCCVLPSTQQERNLRSVWCHSPVDDSLSVQEKQTNGNLCSIKPAKLQTVAKVSKSKCLHEKKYV